jgi:hypothetical protein
MAGRPPRPCRCGHSQPLVSNILPSLPCTRQAASPRWPHVSGWLVRLLPYLKHREYRCRAPNDYQTGCLTPWQTPRSRLPGSGVRGQPLPTALHPTRPPPGQSAAWTEHRLTPGPRSAPASASAPAPATVTAHHHQMAARQQRCNGPSRPPVAAPPAPRHTRRPRQPATVIRSITKWAFPCNTVPPTVPSCWAQKSPVSPGIASCPRQTRRLFSHAAVTAARRSPMSYGE